MSNESGPIEVSLTVKDAPPGTTGNTGGGKYIYDFNPDHVHVERERGHEVEIRYTITDYERFHIDNIYLSDARKQIHHVKKSADGRYISITHRNKKKQLTILTIRVLDTRETASVTCDPQVTNDPPPE